MSQDFPFVSESEIETALRGIDSARDRAIVVLIANSGLCPGELEQLNRNSIQIQKSPEVGMGRVQGKRGQREFFVDPVGLRYLAEWMAQQEGGLSGPLFVDSDHRRMTSSSIGGRLRRWSERLQIQGLGARSLRYTFVVRLSQSGMGSEVAAFLAGHASPHFRPVDGSLPREAIIRQYLSAMARVQDAK